MPIIISDASPLHYLVLISATHVLPALYREVLIPLAVVEELRRAQAPAAVRTWLSNPPAWLNIVPPITEGIPNPAFAHLGKGEREAIILALERAAERALIDLPDAVNSLQATNFRAAPEVIRAMLERDAARKKASK